MTYAGPLKQACEGLNDSMQIFSAEEGNKKPKLRLCIVTLPASLFRTINKHATNAPPFILLTAWR